MLHIGYYQKVVVHTSLYLQLIRNLVFQCCCFANLFIVLDYYKR